MLFMFCVLDLFMFQICGLFWIWLCFLFDAYGIICSMLVCLAFVLEYSYYKQCLDIMCLLYTISFRGSKINIINMSFDIIKNGEIEASSFSFDDVTFIKCFIYIIMLIILQVVFRMCKSTQAVQALVYKVIHCVPKDYVSCVLKLCLLCLN